MESPTIKDTVTTQPKELVTVKEEEEDHLIGKKSNIEISFYLVYSMMKMLSRMGMYSRITTEKQKS